MISRVALDRFGEAVQLFGILHQDAAADRNVRRPFGEQIEQHGIVRLVVGRLGRMRPVASPQHPLRCCFDIGLSHLGGVRVGGRAHLGVDVGARYFDPRAALVDEPANDLEGWMIGAVRLRQASI